MNFEPRKTGGQLEREPVQCLSQSSQPPELIKRFQTPIVSLKPQGDFAEPKDFVVPSVPHLHFEGSRNALAKERVLSRHLTCIAIEVETRESGRAENMEVGYDYLIPPPPCRNP